MADQQGKEAHCGCRKKTKQQWISEVAVLPLLECMRLLSRLFKSLKEF
ncbi:MAG TPA: hypothetical protein VIM62_11525 [Acidobacteriaceae bacterium]